MKTKGDCVSIFLRLLDEATKKGVPISVSKNADYKDKFDYFLDSAQIYIAQLIKIPAVFTVIQYDSKDPLYTGVFEYEMPSNFLSFDSIILKRDSESYELYTNFKWENNKRVRLNPYDVGSFDIHYYKYPATIASDAADNTVLDIEDKAFEVVALQCAIMATAADNPSLSSWIRSLYVEKIQNISQKEQPINNGIQTVFSMV